LNGKYKKLKHNLTEMREMCGLILQHIDEEEKIIDANNNGLIRFDNPKHNLEEEYKSCDNRLRFIFNSYVFAVWNKFKYCPRITVISRTREEQNLIYAGNRDYQRKPWMSTHMTSPIRALDFADKDMTPQIIDFTNKYFEQVIYSGSKETILRHNCGFGHHYHVQVDYSGKTEIKQI
jgi:hypothetical protein